MQFLHSLAQASRAFSRVSLISLWDGDRLLRAATLHLEVNSSGRRGSNKPSAVAVDHTCSFVAVGDCSGGVRVWDLSQTSGTILMKTPQDATGRPPTSISLISWFKAHARRVSFIAFTPNCDIVTVSSGACVRVWSVTGAAIGKVGRAFCSVAARHAEGARFSVHEKEEPEASSRGVADDDDGDEGEVGERGKADGVHRTYRDDEEDDDDDAAGDADDDEKTAADFGQLATQAIKLQRQRHGRLAHRWVARV